jgi:hypothetical protein
MENSRELNVKVDRQVANGDVDLPQFLESVYSQMLRNFSLFGADEKFDIWPEEVTLESIVVFNGTSREYTRAKIEVDEGGNVTGFSDIEKVQRSWVPVGEGVERQATFDLVIIERKGIWEGVV